MQWGGGAKRSDEARTRSASWAGRSAASRCRRSTGRRRPPARVLWPRLWRARGRGVGLRGQAAWCGLAVCGDERPRCASGTSALQAARRGTALTPRPWRPPSRLGSPRSHCAANCAVEHRSNSGQRGQVKSQASRAQSPLLFHRAPRCASRRPLGFCGGYIVFFHGFQGTPIKSIVAGAPAAPTSASHALGHKRDHKSKMAEHHGDAGTKRQLTGG